MLYLPFTITKLFIKLTKIVFHHFVPVNVGPCSLLPHNFQINFRANIEKKDPRLFSDIVPGSKQTIRHIWNSQFSCESISVCFKSAFLVQCCLRRISQHCIGYLPHKRCTLAIDQHSTRDFLRPCWPRQKHLPEVFCKKRFS